MLSSNLWTLITKLIRLGIRGYQVFVDANGDTGVNMTLFDYQPVNSNTSPSSAIQGIMCYQTVNVDF